MLWCMRLYSQVYVQVYANTVHLAKLCGQMNEPSENRLGCNALFTSHYSLIQQLSRNYRYSSIAA